MAYTPIGWTNLPSTDTPINADNLKHMDNEIKDLSDIGTQVTGYGDILTTDGTYNATLYGKIVGTYIGNKIWKINYEGKINYSNAGSSYYNWGISIDKINTLLSLNLRNYTNTSKASNWKALVQGGTMMVSNIEYGSVYEYKSTLNALGFARYYNTSGAIGGWGLDIFPSNTFFMGEIYLKEI